MHLILYPSGAPNAGFHVLYIPTKNKQTDNQKYNVRYPDLFSSLKHIFAYHF